MKLRTQFMLGYIVVFSIMIALSVMMAQSANRLIETQIWVEHTHEVTGKAQYLLRLMLDLETGMRGYSLTGQERFLEPYKSGQKTLVTEIEDLRQLVSDNPPQIKKLDKIEALIGSWQQDFAQKVIQAKSEIVNGMDSVKQSQIVDMVQRGTGKALMDAIRADVAVFVGVENDLMATRKEKAHDAAAFNSLVVVFGNIIAIGFGLIVVFFTSRSILRQVGGEPAIISDLADEISQGNLDLDFAGDPKSSTGIHAAIGRMLISLRQSRALAQEQEWFKTGVSQLDDVLRGLTTVEDVANMSVTQLAKYCNIPVAVLYVNDDENNFCLAGGFAHSISASQRQSFTIGEGLVGQVAKQHEMMEISDVPEGHLNITSGLGVTSSEHLLLIPLIHDDSVLGVVEFGSYHAFTSQEKRFLSQVASPLATAIRMAKSRNLLADALTKSQQFSEELQAQQEELQVANEELEEQTQRLKASEEELQSQQEELQATNEELEEKSLSLEEQQEIMRLKNEALEATQERLEHNSRELQIASKYKSEFLANMSHELRTPLNSLLILSNDLASNTGGNLSPEQVESAEVIFGSGNDLLRLINEILDLSKIESGKMELQIDKIAISDLQDGLRQKFLHMAEVKGLDFEIVVTEEAPAELQSDVQRLVQILNNLISNALKFTTEGKVSVAISRPLADKDLMRSGLVFDRCCAISVSDTGIGIPEDKLEDVFGAFQQVDGSISRQFGGTGLGLTISRELATLLGGELQVESVYGEGSTFTLYLPVDNANQAKSTIKAPSSPVKEMTEPASGKKQAVHVAAPSLDDDREKVSPNDRIILVVEDDLKFAQILMKLCHDKGFSCLHAADGETGLKLAEEFLPSAVLLDIRLPGMHGLEMLKELKGRSGLRHIPVHLVSVEDRAHEALQLGAVGFLSKPATKKELVSVLDRLDDISSGRLRRLLVVEDNPDHRRSIVQLIGNGDVESVEAGSGAEALEFLKKGAIDCMILDLGLPDMDGIELLQKIGSLNIEQPPVIIYTGKTLTQEEEMALKGYTASIIVKGVKSPDRLLDEASLFLHRMVAKMPSHKQQMITDLHDRDELFRGQKLLLVDDDMRNVFALSKVLEKRGLTVTIAANGEMALEALDKDPDIDLVLMDVMMPVMDGYEATRRIRAQSRFAKLPILALTAKAMKEDRGKCVEAGANDYLSKPVDMPKLLSLLRVWLGR